MSSELNAKHIARMHLQDNLPQITIHQQFPYHMDAIHIPIFFSFFFRGITIALKKKKR